MCTIVRVARRVPRRKLLAPALTTPRLPTHNRSNSSALDVAALVTCPPQVRDAELEQIANFLFAAVAIMPALRAARLHHSAASTISFIVAFTYYFFIEEIPDDQETFAADGAGEIPKDSYPGKEDGFIRGENPKGEEVYRYEQNGQVYVIPAEQYYNWRNEYYYDGYHGGLTHVMLQALLFSHLYRVMTFPHAGFVSSYGWHSPTTVYYHSPAYTAHYGAPSFVNGRVVHSTAGAGGTPVVRGTPVAQARPVAVGRPVGGTTAAASSTPIAGTPVATGKPVAAIAAAAVGRLFRRLFGGRSSSTPTASTPTARPTYARPTYRRPPTRYTTRFRSAARLRALSIRRRSP